MASRTGRRGLVVALLALLVLAVVFDLTRPDSLIRSIGGDDAEPMERLIRGVRDELPRTNP